MAINIIVCSLYVPCFDSPITSIFSLSSSNRSNSPLTLNYPKDGIEARHEYMLSVIKDGIDNIEKYEQEWFSKYSQYGESCRKIGFVWEPKKYHPSRIRVMSRSAECRHKPPEIETRLYSDYDHGSYQMMYI